MPADVPARPEGTRAGGRSEPDSQDTDSSPLAALLTLKAIAGAIGTTYSRLRGFADAPGVKELVGAVDTPGMKGVRYPEAAVDLLADLIAAADRQEVTPSTAAGWLRWHLVSRAGANGEGAADAITHGDRGYPLMPQSGDIALLSESSTTDLLAGMAELTAALRQSVHAARESAPVEQMYGLAAAAEATGLSQRTIRANVPYVLDGRRRKYAASDLKTFQASMKRQAPG